MRDSTFGFRASQLRCCGPLEPVHGFPVVGGADRVVLELVESFKRKRTYALRGLRGRCGRFSG